MAGLEGLLQTMAIPFLRTRMCDEPFLNQSFTLFNSHEDP